MKIQQYFDLILITPQLFNLRYYHYYGIVDAMLLRLQYNTTTTDAKATSTAKSSSIITK